MLSAKNAHSAVRSPMAFIRKIWFLLKAEILLNSVILRPLLVLMFRGTFKDGGYLGLGLRSSNDVKRFPATKGESKINHGMINE